MDPLSGRDQGLTNGSVFWQAQQDMDARIRPTPCGSNVRATGPSALTETVALTLSFWSALPRRPHLPLLGGCWSRPLRFLHLAPQLLLRHHSRSVSGLAWPPLPSEQEHKWRASRRNLDLLFRLRNTSLAFFHELNHKYVGHLTSTEYVRLSKNYCHYPYI